MLFSIFVVENSKQSIYNQIEKFRGLKRYVPNDSVENNCNYHRNPDFINSFRRCYHFSFDRPRLVLLVR